MKATSRFFPLGVFLLLTGSALADPSAPASVAPDFLTEALPILQTKYVDFPDLHWKSGDQLKDLIARSNGGIQLMTSPGKKPATPIISALLPGSVVYWRLASFTPEKTWDDLAVQLEQWTRQDVQGIVLDLRSNVAPDDFIGAAQVATFFVHDQANPFIIQGGSVDAVSIVPFHPTHLFRQPIEILINHETTGAAEALAEFLKRHGALLMGQSTPGKAAIFARQSLDSGQVLRYRTASVALADGADLWGRPVIPDIILTVNDQAEKDALSLIGQGRVRDVIAEAAQRHRLNEAALVRGDDPEEDAELASRESPTPAPPAAVTQDIVLVGAIDSLKAIDLSQRRILAPVTAQ
jgi:hypothetical protein